MISNLIEAKPDELGFTLKKPPASQNIKASKRNRTSNLTYKDNLVGADLRDELERVHHLERQARQRSDIRRLKPKSAKFSHSCMD